MYRRVIRVSLNSHVSWNHSNLACDLIENFDGLWLHHRGARIEEACLGKTDGQATAVLGNSHHPAFEFLTKDFLQLVLHFLERLGLGLSSLGFPGRRYDLCGVEAAMHVADNG